MTLVTRLENRFCYVYNVSRISLTKRYRPQSVCFALHSELHSIGDLKQHQRNILEVHVLHQ
jgi:hypothetical protein